MTDCIISFSRWAKLTANSMEYSVLSFVADVSILQFNFIGFNADNCIFHLMSHVSEVYLFGCTATSIFCIETPFVDN